MTEGFYESDNRHQTDRDTKVNCSLIDAILAEFVVEPRVVVECLRQASSRRFDTRAKLRRNSLRAPTPRPKQVPDNVC
jgi:hypothetical protein